MVISCLKCSFGFFLLDCLTTKVLHFATVYIHKSILFTAQKTISDRSVSYIWWLGDFNFIFNFAIVKPDRMERCGWIAAPK